MRPIEQARAVYKREHCARTFDEDVALHARVGYVFDTADFFMMGRPVMSSAPSEAIVNPRVRFSEPLCDCWLLYLFAGNMRAALAAEPFALPFIAVERRNRLSIYPSAAFKQRIAHVVQSQSALA